MPVTFGLGEVKRKKHTIRGRGKASLVITSSHMTQVPDVAFCDVNRQKQRNSLPIEHLA